MKKDENKKTDYTTCIPDPQMVREPLPAYLNRFDRTKNKQQGEYTLEDYLSLPDGRRVELIDGVFYDMASPTSRHQFICDEITVALLTQMKKHRTKCRAFSGPLDVQLDGDDKTVVQPDILITCDASRFRDGRYFGAPDLVMEVVSPSTKKKDQILKLNKYRSAGVREYWIIDLYEESVTVYDFARDNCRVFSFVDNVPLRISDGLLCVDFGEIRRELHSYFGCD